MLDSILFEKQGVPAVPIITVPFNSTANALSELQGMPNYRYVAVEHPITSLGDDELRDRARFAAPLVEAALLGWPDPAAGDRRDAADSLDALVEDLAAGLRSDGADLTAWQRNGRINFELHFLDEACAECVLPYDQLLPIFESRTKAALGDSVELVLHDPRR